MKKRKWIYSTWKF